jgi:hypothetical protein
MRGRAGLAGALRTTRFFTTGTVSNGWWLLGLQQMIFRLIHAYAVRFLTVTQNISRAQEYAADRISAELCGRDTAASAIAEIPAYHTAYRYFRERFADAAVGLGLVPQPEELFPGFGRMLDEPRWRDMVESERHAPSAQPPTKFDSHPPIVDRVSALRALADDGRTQDISPSRAIDLFNDPRALLAAVAGREKHRLDRHPADWDTLVDAVAKVETRKAAGRLVDAMLLIKRDTPVLGDFFDCVEAGQMETLLRRILTPAQAGYAPSESVALEIGGRALASALPAWIIFELAEAGLVRWKHSWSQVAIRDLEGAPEGFETAITALLDAEPSQAAPAAAALRKILSNAGVPV